MDVIKDVFDKGHSPRTPLQNVAGTCHSTEENILSLSRDKARSDYEHLKRKKDDVTFIKSISLKLDLLTRLLKNELSERSKKRRKEEFMFQP